VDNYTAFGFSLEEFSSPSSLLMYSVTNSAAHPHKHTDAEPQTHTHSARDTNQCNHSEADWFTDTHWNSSLHTSQYVLLANSI